MIRAYFTINNEHITQKNQHIDIINMTKIDNSAEMISADGCMARSLGISIYDVTYTGKFDVLPDNYSSMSKRDRLAMLIYNTITIQHHDAVRVAKEIIIKYEEL